LPQSTGSLQVKVQVPVLQEIRQVASSPQASSHEPVLSQISSQDDCPEQSSVQWLAESHSCVQFAPSQVKSDREPDFVVK
jgi:hypothetical protein